MTVQKIIIAEDDNAIIDVVSIVLTDNGYEVIQVATGKELMKAVASEKVSLILLDLNLNGEDGREMISRLQTGQKHLPIVLLSAHSDIAGIVQELGADGYLAKPFDIDDLVRTVRKYSLP